jgi:multicomponent Na+:H+ antiporter subunit D
MATAFLIALLGRRFKISALILSNIATAALTVLSVMAVIGFNANGLEVYKMGGWMPPMGISLVMDGFTAFMLVTVNLIAFFVNIYAVNYMARYTARWKFFTLFMLMITGMNGVVVTGDIFNLYIFLEIAAIASYALVAFGIEHEELEASFKYAVMGSVASTLILLGIIFLYSYTSTLNMADMGRTLIAKGPGSVLALVVPLFLVGFGLKSALVPFHAWLPDAHPSAPAPISAMLSGVLIKSLGVYALCRILYNVIGVDAKISAILLFLGAISMVLGVFLAIGQWDLKRLLAYHSISQIGYVILGIGLGTPLGVLGGLFHLFNHSVFKSLLFLNSGSVEYATGTRDLQRMGGLISKMPVTGTTNMIASMSIAGMPPFNGFWSKLIIIVAAVQAGRPGYAFWAVLASVLTLASFTKVMKYGFYGKLSQKLSGVKEVPVFMKISAIALAVICIAGGVLLISGVNEYFLKNAADALVGGTRYINAVLREAI